MTKLKETIQRSYRGRKVQRADGKERRLSILNATLSIISRDGVRGVRHRAVANEAGVPLSATTYYFKDINELIFDAFTLFVERSNRRNLTLEQNGLAALTKLTQKGKKAREIFAVEVAEAVILHIGKQIKDKKNRRVEWAFKVEAIRNPQFAKLFKIAEAEMVEKIQYFFHSLNSKTPDYQAKLFHGTILHFEYQLLLHRNSIQKLEEWRPQIIQAFTRLVMES